jgi:phosphatidate cytidylyltransferase
LFTFLGLLEFYKLFLPGKAIIIRYAGIITGVAVYIISALVANNILEIHLLLINIPVLGLLLLSGLLAKKEPFVFNFTVIVTGVVYVVFPFALFNFFFNPQHTGIHTMFEIPAGYFAVLWVYDTFAYLIGSRMGKTKLWESISPRKTWEGIAGGAIFGLLTGYLLSVFFEIFTQLEWLGFALLIIVLSSLGDLLESKLKRSVDAKDSGKLLPGHGGILDRFDGTLIAVPFVYIYLLLIL